MLDPDKMSREELLAELVPDRNGPFRSAAERCTTAQLRDVVHGAREQLAFYAAMGLVDAGAPQG